VKVNDIAKYDYEREAYDVDGTCYSARSHDQCELDCRSNLGLYQLKDQCNICSSDAACSTTRKCEIAAGEKLGKCVSASSSSSSSSGGSGDKCCCGCSDVCALADTFEIANGGAACGSACAEACYQADCGAAVISSDGACPAS